MPRPTGNTDSLSSSLTGIKAVDSLISGAQWESTKWWMPGSVTDLTYSFVSLTTSFFATSYSADNEYTSAYALTSAQQNAVISALGSWSAVANITFTLTSDTITNVGDLRFGGYTLMDSETAAWAYTPGSTPKAGDVWIGPGTSEVTPVKGSYDYLTFVHEIGHAIGLKHPFSPNASNNTVLDASLDDVRFTVMSYNDSYSYQPTTPMLLDILAIQSLYGANTLWQAGNNTYSWANDQSVFETIWDAGGIDTIDASNQLNAVRIDLNEGAFSQIGKAFLDLTTLSAFNEGLAIAYGAKIENAVGSSNNDSLIGNGLNNILNGLAGADTMNGGVGNDTYFVDDVGDVVIEGSTSPTEIDTALSWISYTLGSNVEALTLLGSGNLNGTGNALNNVITGNWGQNILDGGAGADTLIGGGGNDTYVVDNTGDVIIENSTVVGEIDTVNASVNYNLGANVENVVLTGTANINANGNTLNNVLTGNSGNNVLNGSTGLDTMIGGAGDDTYYLDQAGEQSLVQENTGEGSDTLRIYYASSGITNTINLGLSNLANVENVWLMGTGGYTVQGNSLDNSLLGSASADNLQGGAGNDRLNGAAGADTLMGGIGDDTYVVDNAGDVIVEGSNEGRDQVITSISYTLQANLEDAQLLGAGDLYLIGNALNNSLIGNGGNNIINGQGGADTMSGGAGNDTYFVDNVGDTIIELGTSLTEIDSVLSTLADYTLSANLENLTLRFNDNLNGTGNARNNIITGNAGNNVLDGGLGADTLIGGLGNDTYVVDNAGDVITETSTLPSEIDTVRSSVNYSLGVNLENLVLTGSTNLVGFGNGLNNSLLGNAGNNILNGGAGNDTLIGGLGADALTGGIGADRFAFTDLSEVGKGALRDVINDFSSLQGDKIDLSLFDADLANSGVNAFSFIGSNEFTGAGQLRFVDQVLSGNVSGNAGADFEIHLVGINTFGAQDLVA